MDADVVPGSVTEWTVTREDQRRLTLAMVTRRMRTSAYWLLGLGAPVLVTGSFWFGMHDPRLGPVGRAVELGITITIGAAFAALTLTLPVSTLPRRVKRDYPVGATLTAWATEAGLGVRTFHRLTFYPWSGLTLVGVGPVFVRCRRADRSAMAVPAYLPCGPDEQARWVDFPVQLIGQEISRELAKGSSRGPVEAPTAGEPVVVDRILRWRLTRAWLRAQFGVTTWLLPAVIGINLLLQLAGGLLQDGCLHDGGPGGRPALMAACR